MQKNNKEENIPHSFSLEKNRTILSAEGILDVDCFDDKTVIAVPQGLRMTIKGSGLKVTAFSAESGKLSVEGKIDSIVYSAALSRKAGLLAKLLK